MRLENYNQDRILFLFLILFINISDYCTIIHVNLSQQLLNTLWSTVAVLLHKAKTDALQQLNITTEDVGRSIFDLLHDDI